MTRYFKGSYQCGNEQCPSNQKEWNEGKKQFVKPNWRNLVDAVTG